MNVRIRVNGATKSRRVSARFTSETSDQIEALINDDLYTVVVKESL